MSGHSESGGFLFNPGFGQAVSPDRRAGLTILVVLLLFSCYESSR
jgi:hypothetical protein